MDIDLSAVAIAEHEVAVPRVVTRDVLVASGFEERTKSRHILVTYRDIDVAVRAGLLAEQSIHAPAAIHPDLDPMFGQEAQ